MNAPPAAGAPSNGSDNQLQSQQQPNTSGGGSGGSGQEEDEFYPLAVLIEELRNEDVRFRLNSIQRLSTIALALGPEKTRVQLIPFLIDSIYDVEDVMVAIAEELGRFVPYVGGVSYAPCIINPLESLALVEDANVREKAVQSLRLLAREHTDRDLQEQMFPLVRRLAAGDWYSSRASACGLFAVVYGRLDATSRQEILSLAQSLTNDDTPMVRRALAAVLGELALAMVGLPPVSDAAAAPSLVGSAVGGPAGGGGISGDQENAEDCPLDRLSAGQQETDATPTATSASTTEADSLFFVPIEETPEVAEARTQIVTSLVPLFNSLAFKDDQESVRLIALEAAVPLARALGSTLAEQHIVQSLQKILDFKSWRSRCLLAKKLTLLQSCLGPRVTKNCLIDLFLALLADDIAEVRCAAASQITGFTNGLLNGQPVSSAVVAFAADKIDSVAASASMAMDGIIEGGSGEVGEGETEDPSTPKALGDAEAFIIQRLLPAMADLNADSNVHVKVKLGQAVLGLAPLLGRELTVAHLLPIILAQLKDESPDVRLGVITSLELVNSVVGVEEVSSSLLPAIVELAKVPVWRVRLAVINQMPLLADQLGEAFFETRLMQHFLSWLADAAYAVREAAVINLTRLTQKFGSLWARTFFLSQIAELSQNENYLQRMISLQCIINLSPVIDAETCSQLLLPTALGMDHDRVPNVRFKVAQALAKVGEVVGAEVVMPCLQRLLKDVDMDVRFYAAEAIEFLKKGPGESGDKREAPAPVMMDTDAEAMVVTSA
ncbi:Serine:threonine protein phosphatase 2A 65 kDa [Echinococcus multilocularis]|uniref:Serine:threonine protein phosphatase 2A 65 kDa n=1 Tax=Echinococcus multilocularis TaxID=6211 RepID=A0A068YKD0_ECHMU|nr:Serine:threonine protein phosphatase 2A 65 kDa [Echinococcus multilocularis]